MTKTCIGCKREIAKEQSRCYICNASQSYIRYYASSFIIMSLMLLASAFIAHWYSQEQSKAQIQLQSQQLASQKQSNVEQLLALKTKLEQANQTIVEFEQSSHSKDSETTQQLAQSQSALKEAESAAEKTTARASWLSKENRRFKAKIAELESKLTADAEQASNSQQLASESVISQLLAKSQATQQQLEQLKASQLVELESANSLQTSETESPNAEDQNSAPLKQAVEGTERQLAEIKVIIEFLQREMNVG